MSTLPVGVRSTKRIRTRSVNSRTWPALDWAATMRSCKVSLTVRITSAGAPGGAMRVVPEAAS